MKATRLGLFATLLTGAVAAVLLTTGSAAGPAAADREPTGEAQKGEPVLVIVELFTSQGCSSCPPADRLLSQIGELAGPGVEPLALSFHVDYWDRLGWRDPFSSPEWSARQSRYAQAFRTNRVYTPQLVIDGHLETVGSDARQVRRLLAEAAETASRAAIELSAKLVPSGLEITAAAQLPEGLGERPCDLMLAVVESGLVTQVERGENEDRRLANDSVVRHLERIGAVSPDGAAAQVASYRLKLGEGWKRDRLAVVAWVQDPQTMAILGGTRAVVSR